jgi:hypothetical protein
MLSPDTRNLPDGFEALEPYVNAWALETERERAAKRWGGDYEEMRRFYDAMVEHITLAIKHLNAFDVNRMPPAESKLMNLALSLAEIANSIEIYKQPGVPKAFSPRQYVPTERGT